MNTGGPISTSQRVSAWDAPRTATVEGRTALRWVGVERVAKALGLDGSTVRRRLQAGDIPGHQMADGGHWRIPYEWLREQLDAVRPARRRVKERASDSDT